jgi:hypothetical protein
MGRLLGGTPYMPPEAIQQIQYMLGNLNPNQQFQQIDRGGVITAGAFDPLNGGFDAEDYGMSMNPTKQYESDTSRYVADRGLDSARVNASRPFAPRAERKPSALRPIQTSEGIMLLNTETGEIMPTGHQPPAKNDGSQTLEKLIAEDPRADGGGLWNWIKGLFTGSEQADLPGMPGMPDNTTPDKIITQQEFAALVSQGFSPEEIQAYGYVVQ